MKYHVTLVTGGSRSGKSACALSLAEAHAPRAFIATAEALDEEMSARIARHRQERGGRFITVEEPLDLAGALRSLPSGTQVALVDCLTVWLGNLLHKYGASDEYYAEIRDFLDLIEDPPAHVILVANEVGWGIVPSDAVTRSFRDMAGWLNQDVARRAGTVILTVCGIPLTLKDNMNREQEA